VLNAPGKSAEIRATNIQHRLSGGCLETLYFEKLSSRLIVEKRKDSLMTNRERFLIGGVGGLAPVLMFLVTGDFERFFSHINVIMLFGYCVRTAVLFFVGGFVVSLYRDEEQRMKIFQLGLGAPAMIAGFLAVSSNSGTPRVASLVSDAAFVTVVHAQTALNEDNLKRFTLPAPSAFDQFLEGLTGYQPKNVWFVIAGSFGSLDRAKAYAGKINDSFPGYHAEVYAPYLDNPNYTVVIGAHLTQSEAKKLREKAVTSGLTKHTYYKTFPNLPLPEGK
jgi:hypothetical protein